jgi:predicted nucleotidyltransferase
MMMQQEESTMNSLINIAGKLPAGLVEMYQVLEECAKALDIEFLIIGAMARDLVLYHGFGADIERGTRDVDFAIQVDSWQEFDQMKEALETQGFIADESEIYRLNFTDSETMPWELDILPFGELSNDQQYIAWPPEGHTIMSTLGFSEALKNSWQVQILDEPEVIVSVANPAAMIVLKIIAWTERNPQLRRKDAQDIAYIIKSYSKIPEVYESLHSDEYMEKCDWDEDLASAMLLGKDIAEMLNDQTREYIQANISNDEDSKRLLAEEMNNKEDWINYLLSSLE